VEQLVSFTIDVDDTGGGREITVSGAEISGALVRVTDASGSISGTFGDDAVALVAHQNCSS
jgi:hypothetical protein